MSRLIPFILGTLVLVGQVGCLIWPFPTGHLLAGRGRITPQYAAAVRVGQSTREEVLLHFGEPDEVQEGGKVFLYRWTEARSFFAVAAYGSGVGIPFPGYRAVRFEFDADARLVRVSFARGQPESAAGTGSTTYP